MGVYYVAKNGSDTYNSGTSVTTPFLTITKALSMAWSGLGDFIYILDSGTYNQKVYVDVGQPHVTIAPMPGQKPVIDCAGLTWVAGDSGVTLAGAYSSFSGFEVKNCNSNGLTTGITGGIGIETPGTNCKVSSCIVHDTWETGIVLNSNTNIAQDCVVYNACQHNLNGAQSIATGWGQGISAGRHLSTIVSGNIIQRCISYNNWGEGIGTFESTGTTIQDCISYDNWATNMYISDAQYCTAQRNILYRSNSPFIGGRSAKDNLTLADEQPTKPRSQNNTVRNNFLLNANFQCMNWSTPAAGLVNAKIYNNTVVDGNFLSDNGGGTNSGSVVKNNIFLGSGNTCFNTTGITFDYNLWGNQGVIGAHDVLTAPGIIRVGNNMPGQLTWTYFKLPLGSSAIAHGLVTTDVPDDFLHNSRVVTNDIGAYQYIPSPVLWDSYTISVVL
jgi:hypothetical protein